MATRSGRRVDIRADGFETSRVHEVREHDLSEHSWFRFARQHRGHLTIRLHSDAGRVLRNGDLRLEHIALRVRHHDLTIRIECECSSACVANAITNILRNHLEES